ncbi:phosphoribosylglycinamide formyltransferase [uncultured Cetobacterium sp.]|uniref:phosphoribosylglycinamide formyltransferase n=1 Tax=uncultured Cetobacterium sp. TaxID=527638 RepID=UPI002638D7DF|nr:phosphoribosylglycinamide formyltransferase [uncultured Cetobacterium sp.]
MVNIAIFASGSGSNFERIVRAKMSGEADGYIIKLLIVDKEDAFAVERAKMLGVKYRVVNPKDFISKKEFELNIIEILKQEIVDYIVLAGYMRIISSTLLNEYTHKIINIHPAYLPEFPGKDGIKDAFDAKVKQTGITIHFVDNGIDTGEIIYQERLKIDSNWNLNDLRKEIHNIEHKIYPIVLTRLFKKGENR